MAWALVDAAVSQPLAQVVEDCRRRALREILSFKDTHVDPCLDAELAEDLRAVIVDEVNHLARIAANIVEAAEQGAAVNQLWLDRLIETFGDPVGQNGGRD